ncbi:MAG: UvrD-helicase domain-containing protein [Betaproteobacteria bacterium]|nr:UvrD-helicase domain-containing protein [Betaproteobacteria bacterium]
MTTDAELERADRAARERALDVASSFVVQAPAGSGKTGLLIQRVLALLAVVERPEQILAMTFTRKAAAEMRERVLRALVDAAADVAVDPARDYDVATRALAQAALANDHRREWQLAANPTRLPIVTIDALATAFARQAPVATGLGALPAFVEDAAHLHRAAVRDALAAAARDDPRWRALLLHVDNDAEALSALLAHMLARRDQWRALPLAEAGPELRAKLERALRVETQTALVRLVALLPADLARALVAHERYAAGWFDSDGGDPARAGLLDALADAGGVPPPSAEALALWRALADWLLVKGDARFRKSTGWNVNFGFPPKGEGPDATARDAAVKAVRAWAAEAATVPGLAAALHAVRTLPPPCYGDPAWTFVAGTLALLKPLAGQLELVFARTGETDFAEATLRALAALGEAADPGELLLATDLRIAHILIDEFQDTSWAQLELVGRLTSGWTAGDGRTLFAVGDPMQSIYRFREAEVRIFLDALATGRVNDVAVEPLHLTRNFRSQAPLVAWVNAVFAYVFPGAADPARGDVPYAPVLATQRAAGAPVPTVDLVADEAEEARAVVRHVRAAQREGAPEIAILVRARSHLAAILPALRAAGIDYAAIDLESLADRLATRDLMTLARALARPSDRIAAFALLRAPWCGLTLADLQCLADAGVGTPVLTLLDDDDVCARMSADGRARSARLRAALAPALAGRGRATLAARARAAWLALGGPACADDVLDLDGAQRFFTLLARHERAGDVPDWRAFADAAGRLFAEPPGDALQPVQVMTLHKAKGLEFDTVILPGLARATARGEDPPLRWAVREQPNGVRTLLLAPLTARVGAASERDPVYAYLAALDREQDDAETGRLLYVGCTRAKRRLHLVAAPGVKAATVKEPRRWSIPRKRSALASLWPGIGDVAMPMEPPAAKAADEVAPPAPPPLLRLPLDWTAPPLPPPLPVPAAAAAGERGPPFDWAQATAAAIGTVAHRLFRQIATEGLPAWSAERVAGAAGRVMAELAGEGADTAACAAAADVVLAAIRHTCADARGRWLFAREHADARSEWALAGVEDGGIAHVTLDRAFVADGVRWIVDFKTGRHEGADPAAFLDREQERYRAQLERYARFVRALDPDDARPIRLGLYHPLVPGGWREWAYD